MLPGEPLSPAQSNAAAKVATIAGAYQVARWTLATFFDPQDWSELNPEQLEFLSDYGLERDDCSRDAIEDALWQFVRYENLSAEVCAAASIPLALKRPSLPAGAFGSPSAALAATCRAISPTPPSTPLRSSAVGPDQINITHRLTWSVRLSNGSCRSSSPDGDSPCETALH